MARILHIEDDAIGLLAVSEMLRAAGHETVEARSGLEGIRLAKTHLPDLVLLDVEVPGLDGYEVTLRLRSVPELRSVPIVALSATHESDKILALGADAFLRKPVERENLLRTLESVLGKASDIRAPVDQDALREATARIVARLEMKVGELESANTRLEEMIVLRREFLRNLSHELSTPMTPVVGYLRLLLDEELGPLNAVQRKALVSVDAATSRLRALIDTLLDVSALETGKLHFFFREYDVGTLFDRALAEMKARFEERRVSLTVEFDAEERLPASGDAEKLRRALAHVLDNAVKFTPPGGTTLVKLEVRKEEPLFSVLVADSGPGVPADRIERVLEPFYQVDGSITRRYGGVGLGLAFARRVAEAMGGELEVRSPPSKELSERGFVGTEVRMTFAARPPFEGRTT